ncbi:MAG TPA: hypothetical protein VK206_01250, partial [Anaerolineales bacterium]|nr:hypothetical protein [Anaerolineales bacterium]
MKKFSLSLPITLFVNILLLAILACSGTFTSTFPTPTNLAPTETATTAPSPVPPTQQVSLSSVLLHEENQAPNYQIKAEVPSLQGSTDPRVVNFNTAITNLVNTEINEFKKNISQLSADTSSPGS